MADEITPRFNLVKPEVGGSADTWGDKWNENADKIDAAIIKPDEENVWSAPQRFDGGLYAGATSPTDTTSGRVLKVGDFGVGRTISIPQGANLNDYTTPGEYFQTTNANAIPELNYPAQLAGSLKVITSTVNGCVQEYTTHGSTRRKFLRGLYDGSWSSWVEFYHSGNVADLISDGNLVQTSDPRLSNAREWTAEVVSQAEAEAGASSVPRKWTAQRVRQAIVAAYNALGIDYPALSPEVQALILGASALHINVPTSGDANALVGTQATKGIQLVNVDAGRNDSRNTWYYPRQSGVEYRRHITFKNNGAVAVKVVVAADLYVGTDDGATARLLVNGSAHHQINIYGGTYQNPVMRRIQFNPVSVSAGQFVYLDIQGRIGDGTGREWVDLGGLYAWLEA